MRTVAQMARLVLELIRYGAATRRSGIVLALLLALAVAAIVMVTSAVAPVVIYPFL